MRYYHYEAEQHFREPECAQINAKITELENTNITLLMRNVFQSTTEYVIVLSLQAFFRNETKIFLSDGLIDGSRFFYYSFSVKVNFHMFVEITKILWSFSSP